MQVKRPCYTVYAEKEKTTNKSYTHKQIQSETDINDTNRKKRQIKKKE